MSISTTVTSYADIGKAVVVGGFIMIVYGDLKKD